MNPTDDDTDPTDNLPVAGTPHLGAWLHQFHCGMCDPIYAVGSCWYAGRTAPLVLVREAALNLHVEAERGVKCKTLAHTLDEMIARTLKGTKP